MPFRSPDELHTLLAMGCEMAQRFYLGRPAPADAIEEVLGLEAGGAALAAAG